jgi:hypothetical protein
MDPFFLLLGVEIPRRHVEGGGLLRWSLIHPLFPAARCEFGGSLFIPAEVDRISSGPETPTGFTVQVHLLAEGSMHALIRSRRRSRA